MSSAKHILVVECKNPPKLSLRSPSRDEGLHSQLLQRRCCVCRMLFYDLPAHAPFLSSGGRELQDPTSMASELLDDDLNTHSTSVNDI